MFDLLPEIYVQRFIGITRLANWQGSVFESCSKIADQPLFLTDAAIVICSLLCDDWPVYILEPFISLLIVCLAIMGVDRRSCQFVCLFIANDANV